MTPDHQTDTPTTPEPTLDEVLERLDESPAAGDDLYTRARESLETTLADLKLTPQEERALQGELGELREIARKLDDHTVEIAAFGMVSRGKSSVLNALLGRDVFRTGPIHGTTFKKEAEVWEGVAPSADSYGNARLVLIDTPGIDEVEGEVRERLARDVAHRADVILFIVSGDMQRREFEALAELREAQKPILLVFNQIDRYPDADRQAIYDKITNERVRDLVRPCDVVMTAARPDPIRVKVRHLDGTTTTAWEQPEPIIEPLKTRILEVLELEGKALVALNALLQAKDIHESIVEHKLMIRDDDANALIYKFSIAKGTAVGLNPIPFADIAGGLAVDIGMIVALSKAYGVPLTRKTATGLVKDMLRALGTLGVVELATRQIAGWVKASLAGVTLATGWLALPLTALGYAAIGLTQGTTAALTSYVLGQAAKIYLKQGCQWGPKGIKTTIQQILLEAKADSVVERLRDDLKRKIDPRERNRTP